MVHRRWHGWLHHMNDHAPQTLAGMDGQPVKYATKHMPNQTGRAGTPSSTRYLPPFHRLSNAHKGHMANERVEAWTPPGSS